MMGDRVCPRHSLWLNMILLLNALHCLEAAHLTFLVLNCSVRDALAPKGLLNRADACPEAIRGR